MGRKKKVNTEETGIELEIPEEKQDEFEVLSPEDEPVMEEEHYWLGDISENLKDTLYHIQKILFSLISMFAYIGAVLFSLSLHNQGLFDDAGTAGLSIMLIFIIAWLRQHVPKK